MKRQRHAFLMRALLLIVYSNKTNFASLSRDTERN